MIPLLAALVFNCNYPGDAERGITVVRAELQITNEVEGVTACLQFRKRGKTCGIYNRHHGKRKNGYGLYSYRFDGFEDYIEQGGASIPTAKRRFGILEHTSQDARFYLRRDRSFFEDATYICKVKE